MKLKLKKQLGQNFLKNQAVLAYIAKAAEVSAGDVVIEVGAGTGLLTEHLAKTGAKIIAVEKDRNLAPVLENKFKNQKNVIIINEDILRLRFNGKSAAHLKVVGNIPYYLTSHLLKKILTEWSEPKLILFMVQKEVAQRITAKPPKIYPIRSLTRDKVASPEDLGKATSYGMSLLSLSVQLYAEPKILKYVPKENFWPMPKVDSALVRILPKNLDSQEKNSIEKILELARTAFSGKRKQLINSLSSKFPRSLLGKRLGEAGIDAKRRPETLSLNEWQKLSKILSSQAGYLD